MARLTSDARRITTHPDWYEAFNIALGYQVGNLLFLSGQAAIDENGDVVGVGDFDSQADQVFRNLQRVLRVAGSDLDKLVKVNIYLTDMAYFAKVVELRKRHFTKPYPADTIVEVKSLALPELMIEIEAVALADGKVGD